MTNQVEVSKTFQEKVFNRIRDSIGELMTDDELRALLDVSIQKAFFEPRKVKDPNAPSYSDRTIDAEPWMVEMIKKLVQSRVDASLNAWLKDNHELVQKKIDDAIDRGFIGCLTHAIDNRMFNSMVSVRNEMTNLLSGKS